MTLLRKVVGIANKVTKSLALQTAVTYQRCTGQDAYGTPTYNAAIKLDATVEWKQKSLTTPSGQLAVSRAIITLLDIKQVEDATNKEGIGDGDLFVLPDGSTGPILDLRGFMDSGTGRPVVTEIFLG